MPAETMADPLRRVISRGRNCLFVKHCKIQLMKNSHRKVRWSSKSRPENCWSKEKESLGKYKTERIP